MYTWVCLLSADTLVWLRAKRVWMKVLLQCWESSVWKWDIMRQYREQAGLWDHWRILVQYIAPLRFHLVWKRFFRVRTKRPPRILQLLGTAFRFKMSHVCRFISSSTSAWFAYLKSSLFVLGSFWGKSLKWNIEILSLSSALTYQNLLYQSCVVWSCWRLL